MSKSNANVVLATALKWLEAGVPPIPIRPGRKQPAVKWMEYQNQMPTQRDVECWFGANPNFDLTDVHRWFGPECKFEVADAQRRFRVAHRNFGLAVVCGWGHLVILDFDQMESFLKWEAEALAGGGVAREVAAHTYRVKTRRGVHLYVRADDPASLQIAGLVEARGLMHYTLVPPSRHPSGIRYQPVDPSASVVQIQSAQDLLQAYIPPPPPAPEPQLARPSAIPTGDRVIAKIKSAFTVYEMALEAGVRNLKSSDRGQGCWYLGLCPFHDDHAPSFWCNTQRQRVGCHSPHCEFHRSGDVVDLFAVHQNISTLEAVTQLARRLPIDPAFIR